MGMYGLPCEPVSSLSPQLGTVFPDGWLKPSPPQLSQWQLALSPGDMNRVCSFLLRATFYVFGHYVPTTLISRLNNTKSFSFPCSRWFLILRTILFSEFFPFWYISFLNHHFQSRICFVCKDDVHVSLPFTPHFQPKCFPAFLLTEDRCSCGERYGEVGGPSLIFYQNICYSPWYGKPNI